MEHFKPLFGPGNSDPAKVLPLNDLDLPYFLSGLASWNFTSGVAAAPGSRTILRVCCKGRPFCCTSDPDFYIPEALLQL